MSSHSDRFHDPSADRSADEPTAAGEQAASGDTAGGDTADPNQRQRRLDAIRQAIDDGVYDHDELFDRALLRMLGHDDFTPDDPPANGPETSGPQHDDPRPEESDESDQG